jgi:hypothetical protein
MSSTKKPEEIIYTDPNAVTPSATPEVVPATTPATGNGVLYTGGEGTPAGAGTPSGAVTPSTGSTTVNPPMTATQYAEWLRQQAVTNAEATRQQTIQASDIARRRSIADANSAYAKSSALYGQNAEKLASMGLQGGGYGEYLTSQAYQQNRSAVQGANAKHLAIEKEALYKEGQDKLAAESQYYSDMLGIQNDQTTAYNTLLTMAQSGATIETIMANNQWGLLSADQQAQIQNATNTNSFKIRIDAGESIDEIMKDEGFNLLSADAQNMLKTYAKEFAEGKAAEELEKGATFDNYVSGAVNALKNGGKTLEQVMEEALYQSGTKDGNISENDIKELKSAAAYYELEKAIQAGTSYDDVLKSELYEDLTTTAATDLKIFADTKAQTDAQAADTAYVNLLDLLSSGVSYNQIKDMEAFKKYIVPGSQRDLDLQSLDANKKISNMIRGSSTWEEITASEYFNKLSDDDKETLKQEYDDELQGQYDDMITAARDGDSMDTIKGMPGYDRLSQAQINNIGDAIELYNMQADSVSSDYGDKKYNQVVEYIENNRYTTLSALRESGSLKGFDDPSKEALENLVIDKMVNNSYYGGANFESQFRKRLALEGYTDEDVDRLVKAWQKNNLDKLKSADETFSSDAIEDAISKGVLPEGSLAALGLSSKKGIYDEYKNGDISADELIEAAGEQNLGVNDLPGFTVSDFHNGDNENFRVTVNGNTYKVFTNKKVSDSSTIGALNELATGDSNTAPNGMHTGEMNNIVVYNGQIYVYTANRGKLKQWQTVTNSLMNKKAYTNLLASLIAYQK